MATFDARTLANVLRRLSAAYGPQHWWPADTPFEIAAGAVLVQRTAWRNAALAVAALKQRGLLEPGRLSGSRPESIRAAIRPAGFAAAKAGYLRDLARLFIRSGGVQGLDTLETATLRSELLAVRGVGPETADAILLYLFRRPVWIADAYALRILSRLAGAPCEPQQQNALLLPWIRSRRVEDLQELHALIVEHGKRHCRVRARCTQCPLTTLCRSVTDSGSDAAR